MFSGEAKRVVLGEARQARAEQMPGALQDFTAVARRRVPPDPAILQAIGLNHHLESAVADLIDNSIDAHAERVLVRFVLQDGLVRQLLIVDNGDGMDESEIDSAMQLGKPKAKAPGTLGHFGMGMKAASFSQASELTVLSKKHDCVPQGRRLLREDQEDFEVETLDPARVAEAFENLWTMFSVGNGTIIRWDKIRTFPAATDPTVTRDFVQAKVGALTHFLGLVFHRLLEKEIVRIEIDVFDANTGLGGFPFNVEPIDPFGYQRNSVTGYPKKLRARFNGRDVKLLCHIWPGHSDSANFKLAGGPIDQYQGFYFYRNDRLLSAGGWAGVAVEKKRLRLARVAMDIQDELDGFNMTVEKSAVHMVADLVHAVERSKSRDGTTFEQYLADAEEAFKTSNKRVRQRQPMVPPGQGLAPRVKRAVAREATMLEAEEPIRFRWTRLDEDEFVRVDRAERTLWLNSDYREALLHGTRGELNDVPMIKALLYLLYEDIFRGTAFGPKDKDNVALWNSVLGAAAEAEARSYYE
jgi:hypothetical protein